MSDAEPPDPAAPFFLIVADDDRNFFSVEGPIPMIAPGKPPRDARATRRGK